MSGRARRRLLLQHRIKAAVHAGTLPDDLSDLGNDDFYRAIRIAFRSIQRTPLRLPNLESKDHLNDLQAKNTHREDEFDLLDDDPDLLHEHLHEAPGWEDYMEAVEKCSQTFLAARDILEPLRRVCRWKYNWRDETGWRDGYLEEVDDYIAPIRLAARDIWHKAYSISKHLGPAGDKTLMHWWLQSLSDWRRPNYINKDRSIPDYAGLAMMAMHEAHLAATAFLKIVRTLDEEAQMAGIDPENDKAVRGMRDRIATFERGEARFAYALLDEAKDYLTAARLAVAQELGAEELQRQVEKAKAQAIASNAPPVERRKKEALIEELKPRWPEIADDMRRYEPWIRAAKLSGQHGYWDRAILMRAGREKGRLRDEVEPYIHPLDAFNMRKRMN